MELAATSLHDGVPFCTNKSGENRTNHSVSTLIILRPRKVTTGVRMQHLEQVSPRSRASSPFEDRRSADGKKYRIGASEAHPIGFEGQSTAAAVSMLMFLQVDTKLLASEVATDASGTA